MGSIHTEKQGRVALITIDRPGLMNAVNSQILRELDAAVREACSDTATGCLVITGEGSKAFVAGADIAEMQPMDEEAARAFSKLGCQLLERLENAPLPIIAAVNGYALGGGCELALACDIILASETAVFSQPEVQLGVIPGFGGTQRLVRRIGPGRARKMIYTAERIRATEALAIGLADQVVPADRLLEEALALGRKIASMPPAALAAAKSAIGLAGQASLAAGLAGEQMIFAACFRCEEQKKAMQAFLDKGK